MVRRLQQLEQPGRKAISMIHARMDEIREALQNQFNAKGSIVSSLYQAFENIEDSIADHVAGACGIILQGEGCFLVTTPSNGR